VGMLRDMREDRLCVAARHVAAGRRLVARQRAIIARLEEGGCSTVGAVRTLDLFERTLAIFEDHYLGILNEIAEPGETQRWWRPPQRGFRRLYLR
jgi:hypothetical protein